MFKKKAKCFILKFEGIFFKYEFYMKKFFALIIFLILIVGLAIWFSKASLLSAYLTKKLKTNVTISDIVYSKSHIKIGNFEIKNPEGHKDRNAFSCKTIDVNFSWDELNQTPSIIANIDMKDNYLLVDCKNALCTENNWSKIIQNVSKKEEADNEKEVIIKKLTMTNLDVDVRGMGAILTITKKVNIPYIEFKDVNSKDGFPTQQLIAAVFHKAGLMDYIKGVFQKNGIIDKVLKFPKLFGENETPKVSDKALK